MYGESTTLLLTDFCRFELQICLLHRNVQMQEQYTIPTIRHLLVILFLSCCCFSGYELYAQSSHKVLFLGNSYTGVNNLPQLIYNVALSAGDTLVFDSHTPGGYQLADHNLDMTSQNKIMAGGWNYVILQGQSQEPVTAFNQFNNGGVALYNLIKQYNPCAVIMPYMTWGRKNGDASNCASFPVMCTYQGMDTTIRNRYLSFTDLINGEVSPVSVVWSYLRQHHPNIELYQPDESHPSVAGSYAAACCFYTSLFKKDPTLITFNSGINATDASIIRNAVKTVVYNNLSAWNFRKPPVSHFSYQVGPGVNEIIFNPISQGVRQTYSWDFGDGFTSSVANPTHAYSSNGTYTVTLTTTTCDLQGVHTSISDTVIQFCSHTPTIYTTNPWLCKNDTLWTQAADSYQWCISGTLLPETGQYLANYLQYGYSGFSVLATQNGCSELSETFTETPQWTGYYFDVIGDPCMGDTVAFAVLHINSFLSGSENILWFKDDVLLPLMTDEDTLLITTSGKYECKVIAPASDCPLDTTSYMIEYHCDISGIPGNEKELFWSLFPNPASEMITITFTSNPVQEEIRIYNATGQFIRAVEVPGTITLSIADLPAGMYYMALKNNRPYTLKFIKQ